MDLFTPATAAQCNYVERKEIDQRLYTEMSIRGKQIIVFGHSGSGKTSSILNVLSRYKYKYIKTHCESNTTFEQLILNAFDSLDTFVTSEASHTASRKHRQELMADYQFIRSCFSKESLNEDKVTYTRTVPPQLTPQKLAQFMGKSDTVWIIEDFHKVAEDEKRRIADMVKIFVDNANEYPLSKIVCIGACESAHELIQLDPNLSSRVSEISVPLLQNAEIEQIIRNGFSLLNTVPCDTLVHNLVHYSDRLGAFAHQMCLDICTSENITKTTYRMRELGENSFQAAIDGFINSKSDTLKTIYQAATKDQLGWYILKTFSHNDSRKLTLKDIINKVNPPHRENQFLEEVISHKLREFSEPPFSIIYYNQKTDKYALSTPFWHRFLRVQFSIEKEKNSNPRSHRKKKKNSKFTDKGLELVDRALYRYIIEELKRI